MESDSIIRTLATALQVVGWLCFAGSQLCTCLSRAAWAERLLVAIVCGLGAITLLGAWHHVGCELTSGLTATILSTFVIGSHRQRHAADPYTLLYPAEPGAVSA